MEGQECIKIRRAGKPDMPQVWSREERYIHTPVNIQQNHTFEVFNLEKLIIFQDWLLKKIC